MVGEQRDVVSHALESSVREFFASYGVEGDVVDPAAEPMEADQAELGSVVGFRGDVVRGGLAFVAPHGLVAELLPVPRDTERPDLQLRDWCAEMANQLVGRIKNKLAMRSVDFDVGIPVCFTGKAIRFVFLPDADGLTLAFRIGAESVRVHLDCSLSAEPAGGTASDLRIVPEGEVLLF